MRALVGSGDPSIGFDREVPSRADPIRWRWLASSSLDQFGEGPDVFAASVSFSFRVDVEAPGAVVMIVGARMLGQPSILRRCSRSTIVPSTYLST